MAIFITFFQARASRWPLISDEKYENGVFDNVHSPIYTYQPFQLCGDHFSESYHHKEKRRHHFRAIVEKHECTALRVNSNHLRNCIMSRVQFGWYDCFIQFSRRCIFTHNDSIEMSIYRNRIRTAKISHTAFGRWIHCFITRYLHSTPL